MNMIIPRWLLTYKIDLKHVIRVRTLILNANWKYQTKGVLMEWDYLICV